MKKLFVFLITLMFSVKSWAQACTTLCPLALGAALTIAQRMGVKNEVVGVLAGALMTVVGYILIRIFDKKKWYFSGRNFLLLFLAIASIGLLYVNRLEYNPALHWHFL